MINQFGQVENRLRLRDPVAAATIARRPGEHSVTLVPMRSRLENLIDEHRAALHDSLEGLTEEEARRKLVPSRTTLLGLVKHVTYVEGV